MNGRRTNARFCNSRQYCIDFNTFISQPPYIIQRNFNSFLAARSMHDHDITSVLT